MTSLVTTDDRIRIVGHLPRRLQRRAEGLDPVRLRLALEAMRVPEYEERSEILQCAPPPMGLARAVWGAGSPVYPPPTSYPNLLQWLTPSAITHSGSNVTSWLDQAPNNGDGVWPHTITSFTGSVTTGGSINGTPGIVYGAGANSSTTNGPGFTIFFKHSLFAVFLSAGGRSQYEGIYDNDYADSFFLGTDSTAGYYQYNCRNTSGPFYGNFLSVHPIDFTGGPEIICATYDGSLTANGTATLSVNGTNTVTSNSMSAFAPPAGSSSAPIAWGGRTSAGGIGGIPGTYGDGMIYTDVKSGADFVNIHRYLGTKYGIAVP